MRHFALLIAMFCTSPVVADDWPQWLGPGRDGHSTEAVPAWTDELKTLWKQPVGEAHSAPVVANGKVFMHGKVRGAEKEEVQAFDAVSGKPLWRQEYDRGTFKNEYGNGPRSTPLYDDGLLYTLGVTGFLTCWDAESGSMKWQINILKDFNVNNLFFGFSTSPMVIGDLLLVMVGSKQGSIVAFDKKTGKVRWQAGEDRASYASPMLTKQGTLQLAVFLTASHLTAVEPQHGNIVWKAPLKDALNESSSTPVRAGDHLFATSVTYGGVLYKLTEKDGKPDLERVWHKKELTCYFGTPIAIGEHLYVVTGSIVPPQASLHCVELKSGKIHWTKKNVGKYHATLLRVQNGLLMLEEKGDLVLVDPNAEGYKELARAKVSGSTWAHPALSDGRFYVRDHAHLHCVQVRK